MWVQTRPPGPLLLCLGLHAWLAAPLTAWDADLELLDLVEEIPQTFYQFLSVAQVSAKRCCLHGNSAACVYL